VTAAAKEKVLQNIKALNKMRNFKLKLGKGEERKY
jgi:hypothetical protein